jgi:hypothetical protein
MIATQAVLGSFAHVNAMLLQANLAGALGEPEGSAALVARVRQSTRSRLQLRQADLVEAYVANDAAVLASLAHDSEFGLIAETARAAQGRPSTLALRVDGPLPALF